MLQTALRQAAAAARFEGLSYTVTTILPICSLDSM
jgi:hypothetical protein